MPKGGGPSSPSFAQAERLSGIQGDFAEKLFAETTPLRASLFGSPGTPGTRTVRRVPTAGSVGLSGMVEPLSYGPGSYAPDAEGIWRPQGETLALSPGGIPRSPSEAFTEEIVETPGTPGTPGILAKLLEESAPPAIRLPPSIQIPPEIVTPQERETIEAQYGTAGERLLSRGVRGGALGQSLTELETARARDITGLESTRAVSDRARRLQQSFLDREFAIQQQELDRQALLETSGMRRQAANLAMGGQAQAVGQGLSGISSAAGTSLGLADLESNLHYLRNFVLLMYCLSSK